MKKIINKKKITDVKQIDELLGIIDTETSKGELPEYNNDEITTVTPTTSDDSEAEGKQRLSPYGYFYGSIGSLRNTTSVGMTESIKGMINDFLIAKGKDTEEFVKKDDTESKIKSFVKTIKNDVTLSDDELINLIKTELNALHKKEL